MPAFGTFSNEQRERKITAYLTGDGTYECSIQKIVRIYPQNAAILKHVALSQKKLCNHFQRSHICIAI